MTLYPSVNLRMMYRVLQVAVITAFEEDAVAVAYSTACRVYILKHVCCSSVDIGPKVL